MLPTEDAAWVGAELARRFGVPQWSFALSATDANRWALRLARMVTGRPKVLAFAYCYHGTVDETFVVRGDDGQTLPRAGNVGPAVPVRRRPPGSRSSTTSTRSSRRWRTETSRASSPSRR